METFISRTILVLLIYCFSFVIADDSWKLYDDSDIAIIHIEIESETLEWIYQNAESDSMHLAQFHFQNNNINESVENIGFRLRGNTSRWSAKKSFKVSFNTFVSGREFYGVDKLNLNGEHNDPSIIRSKLCWDWYQKIGVSAPRANHVAVYINDEYYGLYISVEHVDDEFLQKNFEDGSGNLWKCLWPADLTYRGESPEDYHPYYDDTRPYELKTNEEDYNYSKLAQLIDIINNTPDESFLESLDNFLDISGVLKYFATNVILGGWDDYWFLMNNFYLYHEPSNDRFHWIPYDYDNTFSIDWFNIEWAEINPYSFAIIDDGPRPLSTRLIANGQTRNLYTHFIEFYSQSVLDYDEWETSLLTMRDALIPWVEIDEYRRLDYGFDSDGDITDFIDSYDQNGYSYSHVKRSITEFIEMRLSSLPNQLYYTSMSPIIYDFSFSPSSPTPSDSIRIDAAIFDAEENQGGINFAQIHLNHQSGPSVYTLMFENPVPGTEIVEESDRWTGFIPPLNPGETAEFRILAMDYSGNITFFPLDGFIPIYWGEEIISELKINEFLAINSENAVDNYDEYDDWIEITNISNEPFFLDGYFLSDKSNNLSKWQFPEENIIIEPNGFLLVWCDDDEEQEGLHTNFKLNGNGEFIVLTHPDGTTILDSISFGEQESDVSMGRSFDGTGDWMLFSQPTPGASNNYFSCLIGDVTCDGITDILDIVMMVAWIIEGYNPTEEELLLADISLDGNLDVVDVVLFIDIILSEL